MSNGVFAEVEVVKVVKTRIVPVLITLLFTLALAESASGQSPKKVIDRYRKAIGGSAASRIHNTLLSGAVTLEDGLQGRFSYSAAGPDRIRIDLETADLKVSECYNGKSAWINDSRGLRTLLGPQAKSMRLLALLANGRMRDLGRSRIYPRSAIKSTVEGRQAFAVDLVMNEAAMRLYFDESTGLLVKRERETPDGAEEVLFSDYRKVDGVMEPFSLRIRRWGKDLRVAIEKAEHNVASSRSAFDYPQTGGQPLPDVETLMKSVEANQEKLEDLREHYTFRETVTERKHDGQGRIKESETSVYEVTPVAGDFIRRRVSVDGKELSRSELEKEDRRVEKEVREAIKRREEEQNKPKKEDDDDITILTFLRISEVTSVRREVFRGQEVIAFDFEPRKGFKPKNRQETIVSKLAGTVWVDEPASQIVRLEARLVSSFKLGGGLLASVAPETAVVFEQEKVDGEIWLPSYSEANIAARVMLFVKFNRSAVTQYSDYKKHKVESEYQLKNPPEARIFERSPQAQLRPNSAFFNSAIWPAW
jgi:hypothetical protein